MKLRKISLSLASFLALFTLASAVAHAQLGIYGTFTGNRISGIPYTGTNSSTSNGSFSALGGGGGVYYNLRTYGPVRLGIDARGAVTSSKRGVQPNFIGAGGHLNSALVGVRGVFHTPLAPLHPYVQGSVGLARTDFGKNYALGVTYSNALQYEGFAGLDVQVLPFMDIRVLELGIGAVRGTGTNSGNFPVESVSSGIVFHLPF